MRHLGIRDDMTLYDQSLESLKEHVVEKETKAITKLLFANEKTWTAEQKILTHERVKTKHRQAASKKLVQEKLLISCKTWGGPFTNAGELMTALQTTKRAKILQRWLEQSTAFQKAQHCTEWHCRSCKKVMRGPIRTPHWCMKCQNCTSF